MASSQSERIHAALATVNDPEIRRPITDLGMVRDVEVDADGAVTVTVLLTVSGCPLKDTITRDVTAAVSAVSGVSSVAVHLDVMTPRAAPGAAADPARWAAGQGDPLRPARLAHQGHRRCVGQGRCRQVVGHGQPRVGDGWAGPQGRDRRRRHLRSLGARDARCRRRAPDAGRADDHAGPGAWGERHQHRHAEASPRSGGRLARTDARPGAGADAHRRLLG